jgi:tetratricopeptide (TPR) repeat protein
VAVLEETRAAVAARPAGAAGPADLTGDKRGILTEALAGAYAEVGRFDESVALHRELLAAPPAFMPRAYLLRDLGRVLLRAGRPADAEPVLREAAALIEKDRPADWMRFVVVGDLGWSLLDQRKYAAAEPLLVTAHEELSRRAGGDLGKGPLRGDADHILRDLVDRLVRLYEATDRPGKAAEWRARRVPPLAPPPRPVGR